MDESHLHNDTSHPHNESRRLLSHTDEDEDGNLQLRLPARLGIGTVKAAAWQVRVEGLGGVAQLILDKKCILHRYGHGDQGFILHYSTY